MGWIIWRDAEALRDSGAACVILPKAESGEQVAATAADLRVVQQVSNVPAATLDTVGVGTVKTAPR